MRLMLVLEALMNDFRSKLYHFTTEDNALHILDSDTLLASKPDEYYLELDKRLGASKHRSAISLTRDSKLNPSGMNLANKPQDEDPQEWSNKVNVKFILDSDKIKHRYKIEPFNYDALDKYHGIPVTKNKEAEERVMTDKISNLHRYLINIEYRGDNPKIKQAIDQYEERIKRKKEENQKNIQRF
jgi:hypothetical protein